MKERKKKKENLCSIYFPRIQFGATNIVAIAIVPMYDDARALEDESCAWSRDDLYQVLRERIDLPFDCKREFDNGYCCRKILHVIQDLKQVVTHMDGRRSKQNGVPESH